MQFQLRNYATKEIRTKPKNADEHQLILGKNAGHFNFFIRRNDAYDYTLFIGGGSESEPIFHVKHKFESEKECVLYAQMIVFKEQI